MKSKWYLSTLFLLLFIVFGAFQEQVTIPNQEIVLEFIDVKANNLQQEETVTRVKDRLKALGATNIVVTQDQKGILKISYFSDANVEDIRKVLADGNILLSKKSSKEQDKEEKENNLYNLDIYEIKDDFTLHDTQKNSIVEIKYTSERFTTNNFFASFNREENCKADLIFKVKYKIAKKADFSTKTTLNGEPEVRAGPPVFHI